jgi:hypothetical protein
MRSMYRNRRGANGYYFFLVEASGVVSVFALLRVEAVPTYGATIGALPLV